MNQTLIVLSATMLMTCNSTDDAYETDDTTTTGHVTKAVPLDCPLPDTPTQMTCEPCASCADPVEVVAPPDFPQEDEFKGDPLAACRDIPWREVKNDWQEPISDWCVHRVHNSSRGDQGHVVESRIDGSQIHDRDRPAAWWFYEAAVRLGRLDPEGCEFHRVDKLDGHPSACFVMAKEWPFSHPPEISESTQNNWLNHPHGMEHFGTRGPIDFNVLVGSDALPGCYPFSAFDRNDVSVTALVRRSVRICAKFGCRTKWDIKEHWSDALR